MACWIIWALAKHSHQEQWGHRLSPNWDTAAICESGIQGFQANSSSLLPPSTLVFIMSSPYERRPDHSNGQDGPKKKRKGATRLSCAECRRCVRSRYLWMYVQDIKFFEKFFLGWSYDAIEQFLVVHVLNVDAELSVLMYVKYSTKLFISDVRHI